VAPYFHEFAAAHPSQQVLYASVLLDGSTQSKCDTWHSRGGFGDEWGVTLNDSAAKHFETLFGDTRPQFFVLAPSGEFLDISPNTECGQCGAFDSAKSATLLAPYLATDNASLSPTTVAPTASPTTVAPTASPTTVAPTAPPTSASPTMSPTRTPTALGATRAPSQTPTTSPPTLSPSTATPTTASPSTAAPTASPTSAAPTSAPSAARPTALSPSPSGAPPHLQAWVALAAAVTAALLLQVW